MTTDSSEEEDYMSDAFLAKCGETRPGLVSKTVARKYETEAKHRQLNAINREQNKPRRQLEVEHREQGLQNALTAENKGFKLLEKMGYKPGMAIGKKGVGNIEPITLSVKTSREGLGQESERKRRVEEQRVMRAVMARKRRKHELEFQQNVRAKVVSREVERDFAQSQKVCEQLDSAKNVLQPDRKFFWPAELLPHRVSHEDDDNNDNDDDEEAVEDQEEEWEEEDGDLSTENKLEILTDYLRTKHFYCIWCGTNFNDAVDMESNCPGYTAEDHR